MEPSLCLWNGFNDGTVLWPIALGSTLEKNKVMGDCKAKPAKRLLQPWHFQRANLLAHLVRFQDVPGKATITKLARFACLPPLKGAHKVRSYECEMPILSLDSRHPSCPSMLQKIPATQQPCNTLKQRIQRLIRVWPGRSLFPIVKWQQQDVSTTTRVKATNSNATKPACCAAFWGLA